MGAKNITDNINEMHNDNTIEPNTPHVLPTCRVTLFGGRFNEQSAM